MLYGRVKGCCTCRPVRLNGLFAACAGRHGAAMAPLGCSMRAKPVAAGVLARVLACPAEYQVSNQRRARCACSRRRVRLSAGKMLHYVLDVVELNGIGIGYFDSVAIAFCVKYQGRILKDREAHRTLRAGDSDVV